MRAILRSLLIAVVLFACFSSLAGEQKWVLGMSQCNLNEPWRVQMNADIRKAAAEHPELTVVFKDAQNDTLKQRAHVEEFVASKVNLLIISPKEAAPLTAPVAEAYRKGIPVIVLDRRVLGADYTTFIGADNKKIGRAAGQWAAAKLADKGKIVELKGLMTSTPGQDRHSGFLEGIKGTGLEIIFNADMKWLEPDARKEMESALAVHKRIDLVYAHNDPGAHGAYLAAKAVGREKEMLFVGIDGLPQEGQIYVQQGILAASFEYPTGGKEAIETALRILKGEKMPKEITLRSRVFTPENIKKGGQWLDEIGDSKFEIRDFRISNLEFRISNLGAVKSSFQKGRALRYGAKKQKRFENSAKGIPENVRSISGGHGNDGSRGSSAGRARCSTAVGHDCSSAAI